MVAAFLQLHPSRHPHSAAGGGHRFGSTSSRGGSRGGGGQDAAPLESNLGVLLVDFFRLFGRSLNNDQVRAPLVCVRKLKKGVVCWNSVLSSGGLQQSPLALNGVVVSLRLWGRELTLPACLPALVACACVSLHVHTVCVSRLRASVAP